jgi:glycosyltransferase involved in cell wall biosynthesis
LALELGVGHDVTFRARKPYPEFVEAMSNCAVFVLPSSVEAFPVTLVEAMACGKAVIASDIPGPRDIVRNGHNGLLFEVGDVNALKNLIETVLGDETIRREIGTRARKTVEDGFTFERIGSMYENILRAAQRP